MCCFSTWREWFCVMKLCVICMQVLYWIGQLAKEVSERLIKDQEIVSEGCQVYVHKCACSTYLYL